MTDSIDIDLASLKSSLVESIHQAADLKVLDDIRVSIMGKKGRLTDMMKALSALSPDERKARGAELNAFKEDISALLDQRRSFLEDAEINTRLKHETIDVTLPTRPEQQGHIHPISQTIDEIVAIFSSMGFALTEGPDVETDFNNFEALNMPRNHPARQMQDTFFMPEGPDGETRVLRTQTSAVQVRAMLSQKPPLRIIVPGRTYRSDSDMTHTPMFHQVEGLLIDETSHMGHLKGCLMDFCRAFFGIPDLPLRFRPSFFPFTEPSAEVDIGCSRKGGELKIGNHGDWLEIAGCGMVHPKVLENCGIDSTRYQGFAFGMGIDRIAMLKYGIPDLRTFFEADLRWLKHYGFRALNIPNLAHGLGDSV